MHRISLGIGVFTTTIVMFAAAGCNNDRPAVTAPGPPPPPEIKGTISGRLLLPPNQLLEVEPNETLNQAQDMGQAARLAGAAAAEGPGFPLSSVNA